MENLGQYQITNLVEERFKQMLHLWLDTNAKGPKELCGIFHKALQENKLNRAAEEFKGRYEGLLN